MSPSGMLRLYLSAESHQWYVFLLEVLSFRKAFYHFSNYIGTDRTRQMYTNLVEDTVDFRLAVVYNNFN